MDGSVAPSGSPGVEGSSGYPPHPTLSRHTHTEVFLFYPASLSSRFYRKVQILDLQKRATHPVDVGWDTYK